MDHSGTSGIARRDADARVEIAAIDAVSVGQLETVGFGAERLTTLTAAHSLRQMQWMEPKAMPGTLFRGALSIGNREQTPMGPSDPCLAAAQRWAAGSKAAAALALGTDLLDGGEPSLTYRLVPIRCVGARQFDAAHLDVSSSSIHS